MDSGAMTNTINDPFLFYFRSAYDVGLQKHTHKLSKEEQEDKSGAIERSATKVGQVVFISMVITLSRMGVTLFGMSLKLPVYFFSDSFSPADGDVARYELTNKKKCFVLSI